MRNKKKVETEIQQHADTMSILNSAERLNRAKSLTVGSCFNGVIEVTMRSASNYMWVPMQPEEVIELIHQLSASVGCHIHIQPRNDFASWRPWKKEEDDTLKMHFAPLHPPPLSIVQKVSPPKREVLQEPKINVENITNNSEEIKIEHKESAK